MLKCEHATNLWWISLLSTWWICIEWQTTGISFGCYFLCINCIVDTLFANFLCPQDRRLGAYCFCPVCHSVIPSFCHSETLTLLITLQQWELELWYFTWIFPVIKPFCGYHYFLPCDLDLGVLTHFLKTLTLLITFEQWVLELWYFTWIFPVIRSFCGYHYFLPGDLDLGVWPHFWKH